METSTSIKRKYKRWKPSEEAYIIKNYPTGNVAAIAAHLGTTAAAVETKGFHLGLKRSTRTLRVWTEEKVQLLREEYPSGNLDALADKLGVNRKAMLLKAYKLGVRRLSVAEIKEMAVPEQKAAPVVEQFSDAWRKKWSDADKEWIKAHVGIKTVRQMGLHFRVSDASIKGIADRIGITAAVLSGVKPMVNAAPAAVADPSVKTEWVPFPAVRSAALTDELAMLQGKKLLFEGKAMRVTRVGIGFGKFRVFTDKQTFIKDHAQFGRFLDEIKIDKG